MTQSPSTISLLLNNVVIIPSVVRAETFLLRLLGYMFQPPTSHGYALHLAPCRSIHTFFMRFSLDVIFLDPDHRVVKLVHDLRPWRIAWGPSSATSVIELPAGNVSLNTIHLGDTLTFL